MSDKRTTRFLVWTLALLLVVAFSGCQKLSLKNLTANYHFNKANQLFKDSKYSKAIVEYKAVLENNPNLGAAYRFLGESYKALYLPGKETQENKDRAAEALKALQKAYELDPNSKEVIYSLGDMHDKIRDFDNAEKLYLKIIELEPGNMNNYYVIAEFYKRYAADKEGVGVKAQQMYLRRIETDPENVQGYAYMADYYEKLVTSDAKALAANLNNAYEMHKRRLLIEPNSAEVLYTIGVNRCETARRLPGFFSDAERGKIAAESEKYLLKAIEVDPNFAEPYAYIRVLYLNIHVKLYPEKEARYQEEANRYGDKFTDARKRQLDRLRLEKELKKTG